MARLNRIVLSINFAYKNRLHKFLLVVVLLCGWGGDELCLLTQVKRYTYLRPNAQRNSPNFLPGTQNQRLCIKHCQHPGPQESVLATSRWHHKRVWLDHVTWRTLKPLMEVDYPCWGGQRRTVDEHQAVERHIRRRSAKTMWRMSSPAASYLWSLR